MTPNELRELSNTEDLPTAVADALEWAADQLDLLSGEIKKMYLIEKRTAALETKLKEVVAILSK